MLYLITGVPGSGKTLKMISDLMTREDLKNRPLYLDGIPEVKEDVIPHFPIPEGESMKTWYKWAPTGAILVIDECQRIFRPRPSGSKVPDYVAELETHRHMGIDIFLLTQHPRLIDVNVRTLIEHHYHISKTNLGVRRMVEWEGCGDPQSRQSIADGVKSVYTLDKRAFGVYKSAEEHTKIKTRLSRVVYIFPVVLAAIIGAGYYLYSSWQTPDKAIKAAPMAQTAETLPPPYGGGSGTAVQEPQSSEEPRGARHRQSRRQNAKPLISQRTTTVHVSKAGRKPPPFMTA
nr:zonular occludens toxin domain-containing protein [Neisseria meningitidis]